MFKFLKKDKSDKTPSQTSETDVSPPESPDSKVLDGETVDVSSAPGQVAPGAPEPEADLEPVQHSTGAAAQGPESTTATADSLSGKLKKTRGGFGDRLKSLFTLRKKIDDDLLEEIETLLLTSDVGAEASLKISDALTRRIKRKELGDGDAVWQALRHELMELIEPVEAPLVIDRSMQPFVILVVGVNGVGKTTTIGKLARRLRAEGHSIMLAAGDTFRAAAVEQLQTWGQRNDVAVVAQTSGADSASVIFDALASAKAKGVDVLIADTAGRLHTQTNLMDELRKIKRVMTKLDPKAPHEVMIVIDGGTGQNALSQAEQFHQAVGLTGLTVTKLDGTAKGGVLFALASKLGVPIRFIGVGESAEDLRVFNAGEFVEAIVGQGTS